MQMHHLRRGANLGASARDELFLLNNYPRTGIGDFGRELAAALDKVGARFRVSETSPLGRGVLNQCFRVLSFRGTVVANVGLTSWGPSPLRNFVGFLAIGFRGMLGKPTVVLLHGVIEAIEQKSSGYAFGQSTKWGAHLAVAALRRCRIVVFSKGVAELLRAEYGLRPALVTPIPCRTRTPGSDSRAVPPIVLTTGYLSPYKGLESISAIKALLNHPARFIVVGDPHRVLRNDAGYSRFLDHIAKSFADAGVSQKAYLEDAELDKLIQSASIGLLPYVAIQGASATFSRLASGGLPVVATDLPEFSWLRTLGAGVVTAPSDPNSLAAVIDRLIQNQAELQNLRENQVEFARHYSWDEFVSRFLSVIGEGEVGTVET